MKNAKRILVIAVMAILIVALSATMFMSCSSSSTDYTVGVCQLVQHVALDAATTGFKDALTKELEAAGKTVTIDVQNASGDTATCTTIVNKFVSASYDLIMCNATAPLQAAANATTTIPILGTSVTDYATALDIDNFTGTVGGNISGTSDCAPLDKQAAMILELVPSAEKIGILYCSAEANSKYQADMVKSYLLDLDSTLSVTTYTFTDSNDITSVLNSMVGNVDVVYIPTDNTCASNTETIDAVLLENDIPAICGEEGIALGCGIATLSISYYDLGYVTGQMAAKVLLGEADISEMAIQYASATTYKYVASRCEALGITVPDKYEAISEE